jgi:UDP-glucuronate 4-epimerase
MKIFITGIAGFIGFHLAQELRAYGHEVLGCDDYNGYYDKSLKLDRAKHLGLAEIPVLNNDIRQFRSGLLNGVDVIVHLAAWAGVRNSLENPYTYIDNNLNGTQNIIDAAEKYNIPVVYASSSSVYAGQEPPFVEDMQFKHHLNPYAWTKYSNECQFKSSKLPASIGFRFFTVYGPYGRPDMALHGFTDKIVKGEPIDVYGHGDMSRDFTYVQDIVNGVQLLIDKVHRIDTHEIYNIGSGESVPLMKFVSLIEENLGRKAEINFTEMHPADIRHTLSDLTKIKELGYRPMTNIETGITSFISWYKQYYKKN